MISDWIVTILVLIGVFFLAYSSIRQQGIKDTVEEIKEIISGKAEDAAGAIKYA